MSELNEIINPIIKLKENIDTLNQFKEFDENALDSTLKEEFKKLYEDSTIELEKQETLTYLSGNLIIMPPFFKNTPGQVVQKAVIGQ